MESNKGSVLPFVALGIIMLTGATGTAIDMGRVQIVQTRLQTALDAAGTAVGTELSSTPTDALAQEAQKYFNANFPAGYLNSQIGSVNTSVSTDQTTITISVSGSVPTTMMQLVGVSTVRVSATSTITRSQSGMELVLVVDNSGSMAKPAGGSDTKLAAAQNAIKILLDILYGSTNGAKNDTSPNLWVGLVPFSQAVNIGKSHPSWLDDDYDENLDFGPLVNLQTKSCPSYNGKNGIVYKGAYTEQDKTDINGTVHPGADCCYVTPTNDLPHFGTTNWAGCVESRANGTTGGTQYDINDDTPSTKPFRMYLAPSLWNVDYYLNQWGAWGTCSTGCSIPLTYPVSCVLNTVTYPPCCGASSDSTCVNQQHCNEPPLVTTGYGTQCPANPCPGDKVVPVVCSQTVTDYLNIYQSSNGYQSSTNLGCPATMQPMVSEKSTIVSKLSQMTPTGETEIDIGLAWAWRLLSPKWQGLWGGEMDHTGSKNPAFGTLPLPYNTPLMKKIVILMTDGDNNIVASAYTAYGSPMRGDTIGQLGVIACTWGGDCKAGNNELVKRTTTICTNMKNAGITIYTIALGTDISDTGKTLLKNCASNSSYYFYSPTTSQLKQAFQKIADTLTSLRVSQ